MSSGTDRTARIRSYAFYGAIVVTIAAFVVVTSPFLPYIVTGWTGSFGSRSIYALVIVAGMWTALAGMVVQFYRPTERVNAILWMPFGLLLSATFGLVTGTIFATVTLGVAVVSLVPVLLHPAGRSMLRFDRVPSPNRLLAGLYAVGAIVLVVYGGRELVKQFTLTGEAANRGDYGDLAIAAFSIAVWSGLAIFRRRDWRFATWAAGFVGLSLGVGSSVFPDASSSLGLIGGLLVAVWALTFVAMTERVRGGQIDEPSAIEERTDRPG